METAGITLHESCGSVQFELYRGLLWFRRPGGVAVPSKGLGFIGFRDQRPGPLKPPPPSSSRHGSGLGTVLREIPNFETLNWKA